jgi:hypothetical protein
MVANMGFVMSLAQCHLVGAIFVQDAPRCVLFEPDACGVAVMVDLFFFAKRALLLVQFLRAGFAQRTVAAIEDLLSETRRFISTIYDWLEVRYSTPRLCM